jgi:hypothetical protein
MTAVELALAVAWGVLFALFASRAYSVYTPYLRRAHTRRGGRCVSALSAD